MIMMRTLAFVSVLLVTGCAAPVPKEASMDWPAFIASVPGPLIFDEKYQTSTIKNSPYRAGTSSLERIERSFVTWCNGQNGKTPNPLEGKGAGQSFYQTAVDWNHQERAFFSQLYQGTPNICVDGRGQLIAAIFVHQYNGYLGMTFEANKLPGPVIAFYTPEQAVQFEEFYKKRRTVLNEHSRVSAQQDKDRQTENTRRLRAQPKIGDKTDQGIIIDLRAPLALIQFNAIHRLMFGGVQSKWVPISSLVAPP